MLAGSWRARRERWRAGTSSLSCSARAIAEIAHSATAVDIHPGAVIGARSFPTDGEGHLVRGAPRHPIIEDEVTVFAGATILGRVVIGRGSVIGGGVWLTRDVPPRSRVLQAPVRAESFTEGAGI